MKSGRKVVMEFYAQDPASKDFVQLDTMIDIAIKEAVNEKLREAINTMNRQALDHKTIMTCINIIDNLKI